MTTASKDRRAILPPKGLLISLAAQLPWMWAVWPLQPSVVEVAGGILLLIAGIAVNIRAERAFRRAGVGVCPFSPVPVVVGTGPYAYTRNPMYLGLIAINQAAVFLSGVPLNGWTSLAYATWLHVRFVLPEEAFLRRELGAPYASYAERVPRWLVSGAAGRR